MRQIIYTEHLAGAFEDNLQVCRHCGKIITDYTGSWASNSGEPPRGFAEGPVWCAGRNPQQWTSIKPAENYGGDDPYRRVIRQCTALDEKLFITAEDAELLMADGDMVHTYLNPTGGLLLGADMTRSRLIEIFKQHDGEIQIAGPSARALNHAIVVFHNNDALYIANDKNKLDDYDPQ